MKNQSTVKNLLGGLQWALYMISTGIVMPVVIGQSYHLSPSDASMYIQVTLLCIGLATITQAVFGHRLPHQRNALRPLVRHLHHVCHYRSHVIRLRIGNASRSGILSDPVWCIRIYSEYAGRH